METKFVDYSNICWATLMQVAQAEFSPDRQVDVHVDYRFWNELRFCVGMGGGRIDDDGALVQFQAFPTFVQKVRVLVGTKNRVTFMNSKSVSVGSIKIVEVVGFPVRD